MRSISQELAIWTDYDTGKPKCYQNLFDEMCQRAYDEFWETSVGKAFKARGGDVDRFVQTFFQRFGAGSSVPHPGAPFVERLIEVGQDLLVELPEVQTVAPAPVKPVVNLTPARPVPTPSKECSQFAYMFNDQLMNRGVESCKQKGGFVTLEQNGKKYQYPAAEADVLLEEAISFGLIR